MNLFLNNAKEGKRKNLITYLVVFLISYVILNIVGIFVIALPNLPIDNFIGYFIHFIKNIPFLGHIIGLGVFTLLAVKYIHKRNLLSIVNTCYQLKTGSWIKKIRWNKFLKGMFIWGIVVLLGSIIPIILYPNYYSLNSETNVLFFIISLLLIIPAQSISEEIIFRGYLNQGLSLKIKNPLIIILISSLIFGFFHITSILIFLDMFLLGIILSLFTLLDNGLETAMGIHVINNLFAVLFSANEGIANQTTLLTLTHGIPISVGEILPLILTLIFLILLIIFKRKEIKLLFNK